MKLIELDPQFLRYKQEGNRIFYVHVDTLSDAQGIVFLCPKCFIQNKGRVGTHQVVCWSRSRGVPENATPGPGRWSMDGTGYTDLTLNGELVGKTRGARSVLLLGGCAWHGFVTNGEIN